MKRFVQILTKLLNFSTLDTIFEMWALNDKVELIIISRSLVSEAVNSTVLFIP